MSRHDKAPIHLTFTGPLAGQTLCGEPKDPERGGWHAMYTPLDAISARRTVTGTPLCNACCEAWENA